MVHAARLKPSGRSGMVGLRFVLMLVAIGAAADATAADLYPSRPITLIAPFPAGGPSDALARVLAEPMREALGQPLVIENVPGAGGNIGVARLARAAADGYTIGVGQWSTHVVNPVTYAGLRHDVINDFEPIALLANTPQVIIARKDFPANDVRGLIAWLKNNPDKGAAATVGAAGGAQVDFMFDQAANAMTQIRAGTIKAFAVMAKSRWAGAPDIPTIDEEGSPGLYVSYWYGLWAPKGTPKDIVMKLNGAVVTTLADQAVRQRLFDLGQEIWPRAAQTPEALLVHHKAETEKWWPIIRDTN